MQWVWHSGRCGVIWVVPERLHLSHPMSSNHGIGCRSPGCRQEWATLEKDPVSQRYPGRASPSSACGHQELSGGDIPPHQLIGFLVLSLLFKISSGYPFALTSLIFSSFSSFLSWKGACIQPATLIRCNKDSLVQILNHASPASVSKTLETQKQTLEMLLENFFS